MTSRDRRAVLLGVAVVGAAVLYRFALSPVLDRWQNAREETRSRIELVAQLEDKLDRREAIRRRLEPRFGPGVYESLPMADSARVRFPDAVHSAMRRSGAELQQSEVQGVRRLRELPGVSLFSLRIRIRCPANAVPTVLHELSRSELPVIVESVSLTMPEQGRRDLWQAVLLLSTPTHHEEVRR